MRKLEKTSFFTPLFTLIAVVCSTLLLCSFSPAKSDIEGYIGVYGNEPFTFIGIRTIPKKQSDSEKYYRIICSKEEEKILRETQGFIVHIRGKIVSKEKAFEEYGPDVLSDGVIILSSWNKR